MHYIFLSFFLLTGLSCESQSFDLEEYLKSNKALDAKVDSVFDNLSDHDRVSQLIMPAAGRLGSHSDTIDALVKQHKVGGILLLNGTKDQFANWSKAYSEMNSNAGGLPFFYSADAEPSLVNKKMIGSRKVPRANAIASQEKLNETATIISEDLNAVGINYNFAPVVDVAANKTVGYRGFGSNPANIIPFSQGFVQISQEHNIIATAKHFPGHGLISGDTHKNLQVIDGEMKELKYYPPLIESGVLSIMIAHIAIKNNPDYNTDGLPATLSETIVTDLLRDSLGFEGLIVTDAMNMGGVINVENAYVMAIDAGCDILLMPFSSSQAHKDILKKYREEQDFQEKVNKACKRIIRMKICLGLLEN